MIHIKSGNNSVKIEGNGGHNSIICNGDKLIVNGKRIELSEVSGILEIKIEGEVASIQTDATVSVKGNVRGDINAGGSVNCGDVIGDIDCGGSVNCGNIKGSVDAGGSIKCQNVGRMTQSF